MDKERLSKNILKKGITIKWIITIENQVVIKNHYQETQWILIILSAITPVLAN